MAAVTSMSRFIAKAAVDVARSRLKVRERALTIMTPVTIYSPFATVSYGHNRDYVEAATRLRGGGRERRSHRRLPVSCLTVTDRLLNRTHEHPKSLFLRLFRELTLMSRLVRQSRRRNGLVVFESFEYILLGLAVRSVARRNRVGVIVHNVALGGTAQARTEETVLVVRSTSVAPSG